MDFGSQVPQKESYKFKEITSITGVKPYVLRFWESEFDQIQPTVNEAGHKVYSAKDLELVEKIRDLLFQDKLSIPEAKSMLDEALKQVEAQTANQEMVVSVEEVNEEIVQSEPTENESAQAMPEVREAIRKIVTRHSSSMEMMQDALKQDFADEIEKQKSVISKKSFNDQDVLALVQAKKKLTSVLGKINNVIEKNNW